MFIRLVLTGSKLLNPILPHVQRLWIMRHMCHNFMCLEFSYGKCGFVAGVEIAFLVLLGWIHNIEFNKNISVFLPKQKQKQKQKKKKQKNKNKKEAKISEFQNIHYLKQDPRPKQTSSALIVE